MFDDPQQQQGAPLPQSPMPDGLEWTQQPQPQPGAAPPSLSTLLNMPQQGQQPPATSPVGQFANQISGGAPGAAPPAVDPNAAGPSADPMANVRKYLDDLKAELENGRQDAQRRRQAHTDFLQQVMSTNGLQQYLPKPSAKQMLSDALTNFGMSRLTNGNFTPIQLKRYEEAFKTHQAHIQDVGQALSMDRQDENYYTQMLSQTRLADALSEKATKDAATIQQQQAETARKIAAGQSALNFRREMMNAVQIPTMKDKGAQENAIARFNDARTKLLQYGGKPTEAAAMYLDANGVKETDPDYMEKYLDTLKKITTAAATPSYFNDFKVDADNNLIHLSGNRRSNKVSVDTIEVPAGMGKVSNGGKQALIQIGQSKSLASQLTDILENTKLADGRALKDVGDGSLMDALGATGKERLAYAMYKNGISAKKLDPAIDSPNTGKEDLDKLIQYSALLKIMGAQPYLHGIRNGEYIGQIQQHLPNETHDSPALMYEKLKNLAPQYDMMQNSIMDYEKHPLTGGNGRAPGRTPTPPAPARAKVDIAPPGTAPKKEIITDPNKIKL